MKIRIKKAFFFIVFLAFFSCHNKTNTIQSTNTIIKNTEARDDSIKMARALALQSQFKNVVTASAETKAVESSIGEDAADDPAIWVNKLNIDKSRIIGTNKVAGVNVYDLSGNELQFINVGRINNIDLRDGFNYKNKDVVIVAGSNRTNNSISLFYIDKSTAVLSDTIKNIKSSVDEVYGICMYKNNMDNSFYIFVNGKGGMVEQWYLYTEKEEIMAKLVRNFSVNSQPEGMVADDKKGILYLGVEQEGILKMNASPFSKTVTEWVNNSDSTNKYITYDIEGLALYPTETKTYLIASIQGNFSYAIFETGNPDKYITSFIIKNGVVDGVEETDGIEVVKFPLSTGYPKGLLVVQDGFNYDGDSLVNQNFKFISWEKIEPFLANSFSPN